MVSKIGSWHALHRSVAGALLACAAAAQAACPPQGHTAASLQALKAARWAEPADDAQRHALALALVPCLADADPLLRDELAFEALSAWLRGKRLSVPTMQALRVQLLPMLQRDSGEGFEAPFAALTLAEVARADRIERFMSDAEFDGLVAAGTRYLAGVRDYRGFDAVTGWRHGVAHGADLMLQLALNPRLSAAQAASLRDAIASQVMATGDHAYRFGEPERLMAPIYYLARRDFFDAAGWQAWFEALQARRMRIPPVTAQALAQRHNLAAFATALYAAVQEQAQPVQRDRLLPGLRVVLKALT